MCSEDNQFTNKHRAGHTDRKGWAWGMYLNWNSLLLKKRTVDISLAVVNLFFFFYSDTEMIS